MQEACRHCNPALPGENRFDSWYAPTHSPFFFLVFFRLLRLRLLGGLLAVSEQLVSVPFGRLANDYFPLGVVWLVPGAAGGWAALVARPHVRTDFSVAATEY